MLSLEEGDASRLDGLAIIKPPRNAATLDHTVRRRVATRVLALLLSLSILTLARGGEAQEAGQGQVTVTGTVVNAATGQPLPGVLVVIGRAGVRLESDPAGRFTLARIPVGTYTLELSRAGYHPSVDDFTVMRAGEFVTAMEPVDYGVDGLLTGIIGVVRDGVDGSPVVGATVQTDAAPQGTLTDARGRFSLTELSPGQHLVKFSDLRYMTRADSIHVVPGRLTNVRVSLSVDPVELDPIEVSVERREIVLQDVGFYAREAVGFGKFIDREDIENWAPVELTDLFTRLPGVDVLPDAGNPLERYIMLSGGRSEGCFPRVVLDGMMVQGGGGSAPARLDRLLTPGVVAGVEVYPRSAGVPIQYSGTGSSCGVVIIWTRRGVR